MSESAKLNHLAARPRCSNRSRAWRIPKGQPRPATQQDGAFFMNAHGKPSHRRSKYTCRRILGSPGRTDAEVRGLFRRSRPDGDLHRRSSRGSRMELSDWNDLRLVSPSRPWLYTGPLENHPDRVERISEAHHPSAATRPRPCAATRDPLRVVDVLRKQGLPYLETRTRRPGATPRRKLAGQTHRLGGRPSHPAPGPRDVTSRPSRVTFSSSSMALATRRCSSLSKAVLSWSA